MAVDASGPLSPPPRASTVWRSPPPLPPSPPQPPSPERRPRSLPVASAASRRVAATFDGARSRRQSSAQLRSLTHQPPAEGSAAVLALAVASICCARSPSSGLPTGLRPSAVPRPPAAPHQSLAMKARAERPSRPFHKGQPGPGPRARLGVLLLSFSPLWVLLRHSVRDMPLWERKTPTGDTRCLHYHQHAKHLKPTPPLLRVFYS